MKAVIIGGGFGGLAAAIRMQAKGFDVTLLEKRDKVGGRGYVFEQDGFKFDAGPTIITAPWLITELFTEAGKKQEDYVEMYPVDPFYKIRFDDGSVFTYSGNPDAMLAEIARFAPDDVEGYKKFMAMSAEIFQKGFVELGHVPFDSIWSMVKVAPALIKLESYRSVLGLVQKFFKNEKLRQVFSFHPLLVGGDPQHAPAIYALISHLEQKWGVHYAKGGMGAVVQALAKCFTDIGGTLRVNAEVEEIEVERGLAKGVRLKGGERVPADVVVSNGDVAYTYCNLIAPEHRRVNTNAKMAGMRFSMSLFVAYFGTNRKYEEQPHHMIMMGPRYEGLLTDIFSNRVLAEDFSLYLHAPTRSEPSLAPPGHEGFYVLSPVPNLLATQIDWSTEKEKYRDRIYAYLEKTVLPDLRKHIVTERLWTPNDFKDTLLSHHGAAFSFEPRLLQSAWFRAHNRSEDVDNLYFVGAGTHPGAGIPGVISSAKATVGMLPDPKRAR